MEITKEQKAVLFTNWTAEDFSWKYGGTDYTFKAGQSIYLQDYLAEHFAKHLVDRELDRDKLQTNSHLRAEYEKKCYGQSEVKAESKEKLESALMNEPVPPVEPVSAEKPIEPTPAVPEQPVLAEKPVEPILAVNKFCDSCDSRGVRHKKVCPKYKPTR